MTKNFSLSLSIEPSVDGNWNFLQMFLIDVCFFNLNFWGSRGASGLYDTLPWPFPCLKNLSQNISHTLALNIGKKFLVPSLWNKFVGTKCTLEETKKYALVSQLFLRMWDLLWCWKKKNIVQKVLNCVIGILQNVLLKILHELLWQKEIYLQCRIQSNVIVDRIIHFMFSKII